MSKAPTEFNMLQTGFSSSCRILKTTLPVRDCYDKLGNMVNYAAEFMQKGNKHSNEQLSKGHDESVA